MDIDPSGALDEYFPFDEEERATYLIFNPDQAFDTITDVKDSIFVDLVRQVISVLVSESNTELVDNYVDVYAEDKRARMYDNGYITWGRTDFQTENSANEINDQKYRFIVAKVVQNFRKFELYKPEEIVVKNNDANDEEEWLKRDEDRIVDKKVMKLAFFIEGEELTNRIVDLLDKLIKDVFFEVSMIVILATTILIIFGVMRVKRLAVKMTAQIIHLYEMLYQIATDSKRSQGAVVLSYKDTSKELNMLNLTFNRVARTINLATESMSKHQTEEAQAQALLSYSDAYHIYDEFDKNHP